MTSDCPFPLFFPVFLYIHSLFSFFLYVSLTTWFVKVRFTALLTRRKAYGLPDKETYAGAELACPHVCVCVGVVYR